MIAAALACRPASAAGQTSDHSSRWMLRCRPKCLTWLRSSARWGRIADRCPVSRDLGISPDGCDRVIVACIGADLSVSGPPTARALRHPQQAYTQKPIHSQPANGHARLHYRFRVDSVSEPEKSLCDGVRLCLVASANRRPAGRICLVVNDLQSPFPAARRIRLLSMRLRAAPVVPARSMGSAGKCQRGDALGD